MKKILKPGLIACMLLAGGVSLFAAFANDAEAGKAAREAVAKKDLAAYEKIFKERLAQKKLSSDILNLYTASFRDLFALSPEKCREYFEQARALQNPEPWAYLHLHVRYLQANRSLSDSEALELSRKIIDLSSDCDRSKIGMARFGWQSEQNYLLRLKCYDEAYRIMKKRFENRENSPSGRIQLATYALQAANRMKDQAKAEAILAEADKLYSEKISIDSSTRYILAKAEYFSRQGKNREAYQLLLSLTDRKENPLKKIGWEAQNLASGALAAAIALGSRKDADTVIEKFSPFLTPGQKQNLQKRIDQAKNLK